MSIFGNIMSKIFHHDAAPTAGAPAKSDASPTKTASAGTETASAETATPTAGTQTAKVPSGGAAASIDVAAILNEKASTAGQKLDWKHSIVDLMKLLDLDSSLTARKQLADELHYTGDKNDSAQMNVWLHKQVMVKLAENGGKVPEELKA
jgi:hypothetical protein